MPKRAKELTDLEVRRLRYGGKGWRTIHSVGGAAGLCLQVLASGERSWVLRYAVGSKRKELPLGGYPAVTLAVAKGKAFAVRGRIKENKDDPAAERQSKKQAERAEQKARTDEAAKAITFSEAVEQFLNMKLIEFENAKHRKQWPATLHKYAEPSIGDKPVADVTVEDIITVLTPIWKTKTETAKRLRGRIEAVLSWATINKHRSGPNPAMWRGNLEYALPKPSKVAKVQNQPTVATDEFQSWFAALRNRNGMAALALEFLTLTAARSGEVRAAEWSEIDMDKAVWTIPAHKMKMRRAHRVPLSAPALRLLRILPRMQRDKDDNRPDTVFWAPRGGQLSDMSLAAVMKRMQASEEAKGRSGWLDPISSRCAVPHGLRSSFRDWAAEMTNYAPAMAELALAHRVGGAVELAYRRGDMMEKRRAMMDDWAIFVGADAGSLAVVTG